MQESTKIVLGGLIGVAIGGFIGYVVTDRVLKSKYEARADAEIESVLRRHREEAEPSEEEILRRANELLIADLNYHSVEDAPIEEAPSAAEVRPEITYDVMTEYEREEIDKNDELLQEMIDSRRNNVPYVITIDEFMDDDQYEKITLTYFDGDGTLVDSADKPILEIEMTVSSDALTKFGLFSKDKNIVYVRNERSEMDFEICLDQRSYIEAVAGFKQPKSHMKMREDD